MSDTRVVIAVPNGGTVLLYGTDRGEHFPDAESAERHLKSLGPSKLLDNAVIIHPVMLPFGNLESDVEAYERAFNEDVPF